jgi:hypothetical protein
VPTYNVIPTSYISPIMQANQQFLPPPTNPAVIANNFVGGFPSGYDNHVIDWRVDYDLSKKQRISSVGAMGTYAYLNNFAGPFITTASGGATPYIGGDLADIFPKNYQVEDSYVINARMTNQFKFGFTRFYQDIKDETQGIAAWEEATLGVTNLPGGSSGPGVLRRDRLAPRLDSPAATYPLRGGERPVRCRPSLRPRITIRSSTICNG